MTIRELRLKRGISQKDLAKELGVPANTFNQWENGKREPDNSMLCKIAEFLGVSVDCLLGREEQKEKPTDNVDELPEEYESVVNDLMKLSPEQFEIMKKFLRSLQSD